ncbi:hypothetical protein FB45DRAFT_916823 [Roridomyces roridus]|uniref:NADH-ubiquinone oxidoreductase subunit B14.7 n=1 Tax=Roridomyces roridus TaxID=1738132 RepID=A0AAD7BUH9_9AGAR|nr:hypothetical protein FB45DRAFT_916823 [Roridomyces roridus]
MAEGGGPAAQLKDLVLSVYSKAPPTSPPKSSEYQSKDSIGNAMRLGGQSAIAGVIFAGLRNALSGRNAGFLLPIGLFTAVGTTFAWTEAVVANKREVNDEINGAAGACAAGFLLGLRKGSLPMAVGTCAVMGGMMGLLDATTAGGRKPSSDKPFFKPTAVVEAVKA